jgi:hypothetical protein
MHPTLTTSRTQNSAEPSGFAFLADRSAVGRVCGSGHQVEHRWWLSSSGTARGRVVQASAHHQDVLFVAELDQLCVSLGTRRLRSAVFPSKLRCVAWGARSMLADLFAVDTASVRPTAPAATHTVTLAPYCSWSVFVAHACSNKHHGTLNSAQESLRAALPLSPPRWAGRGGRCPPRLGRNRRTEVVVGGILSPGRPARCV